MTRRTLLLTSVLALPVIATAPSVDGRWIGTVTMRGGDSADIEFNFKTSGESLTGTITVLLDNPEPFPIREGKVKGNNISFQADRPRGKFNGMIAGDQIDMSVTRGDEDTLQFTLKRTK